MRGIINMESSRSWVQKLCNSNPSELDLKGLRSAFNNFNDLIQLFPTSIYAENARQHMIYIRNVLADNEINAANYYFNRKAYVAAANRANYVVKHFDGAPQVLQALQIMIKSYQALGMTEEANTASRILQLNSTK
jgi:outer membrane protein assembly factor BamD